ncbi:DMT family transporter [Aquisalimonas asiatica]|uniref:Threonine/homoserine efflux transporter RhtA n=1 Tax=Aquisalimonas asiatica TaxID=406100 RepID=A0A1H8VP62_9GAMM|nr:DMT family transporter [Aquisalimonas asiatica]SEP17196.1 Threonine/homoserine efflux transporter RhtA [Aquisalimonas asiatica]
MNRGLLEQALKGAPVVFLLMWASGFVFAAMALPHTDPMTLLALRYALVVAVLLPLYFLLRPALPKTPLEWLHVAVVGLCIQVFFFGGVYMALEYGLSAGAVALIASLHPIVVGFLAAPLVGERVNLQGWIGLILGLLGAGIVITSRMAVEATSLISIAFAVCSLLAMTSATLYEKRFGVAQHPVSANIVQCGIGFLVLMPIAWALEPLRVDWTGEFIIAITYLVVGNSLIAVTLLLAMVRRGLASRVSALFFLVPPVSAVIAWLVLGEVMPLAAWGGILLAAVGVALISEPGQQARRALTARLRTGS